MPEIQLTRGFSAIVDEEDFQWISQKKWSAKKGKCTWYGYSNSRYTRGQRRKCLLMHREIFFTLNPQSDMSLDVDHRDGNGLNNRRSNLRLATDSSQRHNQTIRVNNTSGYIGVCWHKRVGKFQARIRLNTHRQHLGFFDDPIEAAMVRDEAARKLHGEFGTYNFPREGERPARIPLQPL